jgi:ATP-dependent helicase/nuclease subunit B
VVIWITGPSGSGKTSWIRQQVRQRMEHWQPGQPKDILLVPEQFTLMSEREMLIQLGNRASACVEVLSFKRLANRVFAEMGGAAGQYADQTTASLAMAAAISRTEEELTLLRRIGKRQDAVEQLLSLMTELKYYNVTAEQLGEYALSQEGNFRLKLLDVATLYNEYNQILSRGYKDPRDDLTRLAEKMDGCSYLQGRRVWLDGFSGFTPQELRIVEKLMLYCPEVGITLCMDDRPDPEGIFLHTQGTLRQLQQLAQGLGVETRQVTLGTRHGRTPLMDHLEGNLFALRPEVWQGDCQEVKIFQCGDPYQEVECAANEIRRLVTQEGLHHRDILLIARQISDYSDTIEAVFRRHGIPVFMDHKTAILTKPVLMAVLSAVEILTSRFRYDTVFAYLKTGLSGLTQDEVDRLENYAIKWNLRGNKWLQPFHLPPAQRSERMTEEEQQAELEKLESLRLRLVRPLLELREGMSGRKTVRQRATALYQWLVRVELPHNITLQAQRCEQLGELAAAQEYRMLWDILMGVLDQLVEVLGEEYLSLGDFYEIFRGGLSTYDVGLIPTSLDEVSAAGCDRVRSPHVPCVMLLGVNEGVFPLSQQEEGLFSDAEKETLRQAGIHTSMGARERIFQEMSYLYSAVTFSTRHLYAFYATSDGKGGSRAPASVIQRLREIVPSVETVDAVQRMADPMQIFLPRKLADLAAWEQTPGGQQLAEYLEQTQPALEPALRAAQHQVGRPMIRDTSLITAAFGEVMEKSASRVERYQSCPFSYFMQYALRANPRDRVVFSPVEMGSFVHFVLERFFDCLKQQGRSLRELEPVEGRRLAAQCVREFLEQEDIHLEAQSSRAKYLFKRITATIYAVIRQLIEEFSRSDFEPIRFELVLGRGEDQVPPLEYETALGHRLRIVGKVDRVDGYQRDGQLFVRIVDYKTGKKTFDFSDVYSGLSVQMLIYLFSLWENGQKLFGQPVQPGGMLYFRAFQPLIECRRTDSPQQVEQEIRKQYKMSGLVLEDEEIIEAMEASEDGKRIYVPVTAGRDGLKGNTATLEKFRKLERYMEKLIRQMADELEAGRIEARPYWKKGQRPCDYCPYASACMFEGNREECRVLTAMDANTFWEKVQEEVEEDG